MIFPLKKMLYLEILGDFHIKVLHSFLPRWESSLRVNNVNRDWFSSWKSETFCAIQLYQLSVFSQTKTQYNILYIINI